MSRSVVHAVHLRPRIAYARHSAAAQRLTGHAFGHSARLAVTPGPGAEPGLVSYHPGPGFIAREPEAGS